MKWPWRMGMTILAIVPGIVGGGLFWAIFGKWSAVIVWEIVLLFLLSVVIVKGDKNTGDAH